jgi:hypothetical protein
VSDVSVPSGFTLADVPELERLSLPTADGFAPSFEPERVVHEATPGEVSTRGGGSQVTITIDNNTPYRLGWVVAAGRTYMTDANGRVTIPVDGAVDLEVWAENHAVRVVDGQNAVLFPFIQRFKLPSSGGWTCNIQNQQYAYYVANFAIDAYTTFLRKRGHSGPLPKNMARLVFPDGAFPESFCEPKSIVVAGVNKEFDEKPLIHLKWHNDWKLAERHVHEELAHSLHFLELSVQQRHEVTWQYVDWLKNEWLSGGDMRHHFEKRTNELIAYLEGWDAYFTAATMPGEAYFAIGNVNNVFNNMKAKGTIKPGDGRNFEVAIAGLLHDIAAARGDGFLWNCYAAKSKATTFSEFDAAWKRNDPGSYGLMQQLGKKWLIIP